MHHGKRDDGGQPDIIRQLREAAAQAREPLGATGRYPDGQLDPTDEGEIRIAVAADREGRKVVIDFGKPVTWIAFDPKQARAIAEALRKQSYVAEG